MTITEAPPSTTRPHVTVLVDRCAGCQECIVRCPTSALELELDTMVAAAHDALCVGCRQCVRTCPFDAIDVAGPVVVADRVVLPVAHPPLLAGDTSETRQGIAGWADARSEAERCITCPDPTCVRGCPAHNDIPSFIAAIRSRDLQGAHEVLRRTSVLPDVCARVCDHAIQCEGACTWSLAGEQPVAIAALERFVCDQADVPAPAVPAQRAGVRVAVVGSGPAGLAAAWELVERGVEVDVYDKDEQPGGLLRWGIPDFTLAAPIADRPATALAAAGVRFHLGVEMTADDLDRLATERDAVVVAIGAGRAVHLGMAGSQLDGVWDSTRFLVEAHGALQQRRPLAELSGRAPRVLVIGAGNTAMDVARTARRLGADAVCVEWMDQRFAPVRPDELAEAEGEGVTIRFTTTVEAVEAGPDGALTAVLARTRQRRAGHQPTVVAHASERLDVALVVMALGYRMDAELSPRCGPVPIDKRPPEFVDRRWLASGILAVDAPPAARHRPVGALALAREMARRGAGAPMRDNIWVAGDALTGPATVVEAMAQGRQAARGILATFSPPAPG